MINITKSLLRRGPSISSPLSRFSICSGLLVILAPLGSMAGELPNSIDISTAATNPIAGSLVNDGFQSQGETGFGKTNVFAVKLNSYSANLLDIYKSEVEEIRNQYFQKVRNLNPQQTATLSEVVNSLNEFSWSQFKKHHRQKGKISSAKVADILAHIPTHPVVGLSAEKTYDPKRQIGFCFGRATYVHWALQSLAVSEMDMVKVFAVGKFLRFYQFWDYHVATLVNTNDKGWMVVDSFFDHLMRPIDWMSQVNTWSVNDESPVNRFYISDPRKLLPIASQEGSEFESLPLYRNYFIDLRREFKKPKVGLKKQQAT